MVFPYGILVNEHGHRFVDEGAGLADEICEDVARRIWAEPGGVAWFVSSIAELASLVDIPASALETTVREFNAAGTEGAYGSESLDGRHTSGLTPKRSNWAQPLDQSIHSVVAERVPEATIWIAACSVSHGPATPPMRAVAGSGTPSRPGGLPVLPSR